MGFSECRDHWRIARDAVLKGDMKTYMKHIYPATLPIAMHLFVVFIVVIGFRSFWALTCLEFFPALSLAFLLKVIVSGVKVNWIAKRVAGALGFGGNARTLGVLIAVFLVVDIVLCVNGYRAFYTVTGFSRLNAAGILLFVKFLLGGIKFG